MISWLIVCVIMFTGGQDTRSKILASGIPISGCKVLDLTHELNYKSPYYPLYKPFNLTYSFSGPAANVDYVEYNFICSYEHIGTHIDAPSHFSRSGHRTHKIPINTVIGEACVVDITAKTAKNRDYCMTVDDAKEWEAKNGHFDSDSIVLLYTGQQSLYWNMNHYFGTDNISDHTNFHFSAFSGEVAKWLIEKRNVKSVGVDCISLDGAQHGGKFPAHVNFLHHGKITGYENLNNLDKLPARGATFFGVPLKITNGSGSPVRAFALGWQGIDDPCRKQNMILISGGSDLRLISVQHCLGTVFTAILFAFSY